MVHTRFTPSPLLMLLLACCLPLLPNTASANGADLNAYYKSLKPVLEKNVYGMPVYISSSDKDRIMTGSIYGILQHDYADLAKHVRPAKNWCEIAPLHLNIKACTYQLDKGQCMINFYSGRKFYEKADDVYHLAYQFKLVQQEQDYFHIQLLAKEGPMGTGDYQLDFEATPIDQNRSFVHFRYAYRYSLIASMGMSTYLATLGSGKLGFSIKGQNENGQPVYIDGVRGVIERNAVRYYLAIKSYLATIKLAPQQRFEASLNHWFDQTEKYALQLHEMDKASYLDFKRRERQDQQRLQQAVGSAEARSACQ